MFQPCGLDTLLSNTPMTSSLLRAFGELTDFHTHPPPLLVFHAGFRARFRADSVGVHIKEPGGAVLNDMI